MPCPERIHYGSGRRFFCSRQAGEWQDTPCSSFNTYPQGNFEDVLATVKALHKAGVDILVGTDASVPQPHLGGLAHGASVHHELQMFYRRIHAYRGTSSGYCASDAAIWIERSRLYNSWG